MRGITWKSDDPYIATVDSNGKITGISKGKTKITASNDEYVAVFEVNVTSGERPAKMPDEVVTNDPEDITPSEPDEIVTNEPEDITTTNPGEVTNEPEDVTTNEPENINPTEQDGNNTDVQKDIAPVDENKPFVFGIIEIHTDKLRDLFESGILENTAICNVTLNGFIMHIKFYKHSKDITPKFQSYVKESYQLLLK